MKTKSLFFLILIFFITFPAAYGQKKNVGIVCDGKVTSVDKKEKLPRKSKHVEKLRTYFPAYVYQKQVDGYLTFSIDTVVETETQFLIHVFEDAKYDLQSIIVEKEERALIQQAGAASFVKNGKISLLKYPEFAHKIISYYEQKGFPFTQVYLDSFNLKNNQIEAQLQIERNQFVLFDSIILKGSAKLSYGYLYPYLGLRRNKPYNEKVIQKIPQRMQALSFVSQIMPPGIEFIDNKAYLYLYLDKQKVNQFDGYVAIVPVDEETGKVSFSGELNLGLKNVFALGESMSLEWRSVSRFSQYLNVRANFPYLFRTPFGVDGSFLLDKTDTSYLNMNYLIGLQYSFAGNNYIKTYLDYTSSNVLSKELLVVSEDDFTFADYTKQLYGIELMVRKLDYIYNPRKGFSILLNGSAGKISIKKNHSVDQEIYENVDLDRIRYRLLADVKGYIPVWKNFILHLNGRFGMLFGDNNLENEIFKIGGFNSLRGFDENAILASSYTIGLAEIRYLFAKNSYVHLFCNMAWHERKTTASYDKDIPYGVGAGVAFQTKAGLFNLVYALGKQYDNPMSFKTGKIHFGIVLNF